MGNTLHSDHEIDVIEVLSENNPGFEEANIDNYYRDLPSTSVPDFASQDNRPKDQIEVLDDDLLELLSSLNDS